MLITILKSKIYGVCVTDVNLNYEGSIIIDKVLMEASGIIPFERVDILNLNNGERFSTYAIEGEAGVISVNGAAARLVVVGDRLIILSYAQMDYDVGPVWDLPKIVDGSQKLVI